MALQLYNWASGNQNLEEYLNLMRNKGRALIARAADISTEVRNAELHPEKKREREVDNWMQNAKELHNRIERIEIEVEQGVTSNRHRLRNQIVEITEEIEELLQQGTFPNDLVIHDLGSSSLPFITTHMTGQQFEENLRRILHWLKADKVSNIGVYGVGGVGKTTLATHIHNQLLRDLGKCASVWVTVSKDCTVSVLQDKIVKALDQPKILDKADKMKRPEILHEALKKRSNVVVILDDMWNHFPLEVVGLPIGENGCKLLLTTRSLDVCRRMECQRSVKVGSLSEEESWSLFVEKLGNYDELSLEAKATAKLVAKECGGLPLGIKVVAAGMRGVSDDYEWNNTLEDLRNPTRIHEGMENEVFPSLQLSYVWLNDVMLQKCFLSCALHPKDSELQRDKLVNLWIMEGHLEGIQSRQKQLDKAHSMLNRLVSACLLDALDSLSPRKNGVKMHGLIRTMAIRISSQRDHVMIKAGMGLRQVPPLQEWTEELTKVSLIGNSISDIPAGMTPICPNLSCLFLEGNPLVTIPDSFLMCFNGLTFLDLSWTSIESVPNSVSDLENLSALNLAVCRRLLYVPPLVKLTKLRHLNLSYCSEIRDLPKGIEKLVNLECLVLVACDKLCVPFSQLTHGLSNIQCLELSSDVEDEQITDIQKLGSLERLKGCQIHGINNFNKYVRSQHLNDVKMHDLISDTAIMEEIKDYFSIFYLVPTDYEFEEDTLIQLWMAKECIKDESQGQTRFHSLLNGQFLLQSGTNFVTRKARYRMNTKKTNDLLDGQKDMYGRFYLKWEDESQRNITNSTEMQHVSLVCNDIDASVFQTLQQFTKLRTLLFLRNYGNKVTQVPDRLFLSCQKLQALDLSRTHIKKLSSFVANLIHLRFLDLSWTLIEWLPDTICSLTELQTLKLKGCVKLRGLPRQLKKLTKLRHLDVDVLRQLATLPGGIGALVSLRTLSAFLVGTEDGCKIQELRDLNNLTGDFCISMLENVGNGDEANEAAVINKQYINKLELRWTASQLLRTNNNCYDVLKCLRPCSSLRELQIFCYEGSTFPNWVSDPTFNQLISITFFKCEHVSELPLIEQLPFLKQLGLVKMNGVKKMERRGKPEQVAFSSLEKLEIDGMQSLEVWSWVKTNEGDFKSLVELTINDCPELHEFHVLPCLSSVSYLEVRGCPKLESLSETKLPDSLEELIVEDCPRIKSKCSPQGGEDWQKIQHVSNIRICEEDDDDDEC